MTSPQKPVMNPSGRSTPTVLTIFVARPCVPSDGDEHEGEDDAAHVGGDAGERHHDVAQPARPLQADDDEGEQRADESAEQRRHDRELERLGEVAAERPAHRLAHRRDVRVLGLGEGLDEHGDRRHDQEQSEEDEERDQSDPRSRPPDAAGCAASPPPQGRARLPARPRRRTPSRQLAGWCRSTSSRRRGAPTHASATIGPQFSARSAWAAAIWSAVGKAICSISSAGGRLASMSSVIVPFSTSVA